MADKDNGAAPRVAQAASLLFRSVARYGPGGGEAGCQPAKQQRATLRYRPARTQWPTPHRQPARN